MSTTELLKPIFDSVSIRSVNFFNGRLLSAEDLNREQAANRDARERLGRAVGDGIAFGLEVAPAIGNTASSPSVTIQPGLAVNRRGQVLALAGKIDVSLVRVAANGSGAATTFAECVPTQTTVVSGEGVYLLVLGPASTGEGRAPVSGLGNVSAPCNIRYNVDAVTCRLIPLHLTTELSDPKRLRNRVAYRCFGVAETQSFVNDLFPPSAPEHGLLDELRPTVLTDCDVPLALVYWTRTGLEFVDMWAVRRRLTEPSASGRWSGLVGDRRLSQGEAMVFQFRDQVDALRTKEPNPQQVTATQYFDHLPPVGILPLSGPGAVDHSKFFDGVKYRGPAFIDGTKVGPLLRMGVAYPSVDLASHEMIWLYAVRQNREAIAKTPLKPPQAYVIFTNGHLPYQGDARYDLARWNYSNYALGAAAES